MASQISLEAPVSTKRSSHIDNPVLRIFVCIAAVFAATVVLYTLPLRDRALTAAFIFLFLVLVASAIWGFRYTLFVSFLTALAFSWLMPPVGVFWISDSRDVFTLAAFLVIGTFVSRLSDRARRETLNANQRRTEAVAARQRFADLVNSVEGIVWEADANTFVFSFVSKQAVHILGYPAEQWLNEPTFWKDHLHPDDRDWAVQFCLKATGETRSYDFEYRMIAADGRVVWMRDLVTVAVENGRPIRLRGVMVDVTERKRAEQRNERLRQLEADLAHINRVSMMGELAASLGHEIKQPMAAAMVDARTCLRWLTRAQPNLEEAREAASRMVEDTVRAIEIVNRTSSLYKKGALQRELVNINEVIKDILGLLRNEAIRYGISIRGELGADLPDVIADRVQLQQVLMNLMINSIDAMKGVDSIRELIITSERDGNDQLLVTVSDTGGDFRQKQSGSFMPSSQPSLTGRAWDWQ